LLNLAFGGSKAAQAQLKYEGVSDYDRGLLPALDRLRARWRVVAWTCGVAVAAALAVSVALPEKYTATARIVIEPPAGSDPRASTAVSPIYLESLRSYEIFAVSDSVFAEAVKRFGLRQGAEPIDKLKRKVLEAEIPRNTKILEIHATLPDPAKAHALAVYIAEETVKLNRAASREADQELTAEVTRQAAEARERMEKAEAAWNRALAEGPVEPLRIDLQSDEKLRDVLERELTESEVIADRERAEGYRKRLEPLRRSIGEKRRLLAQRSVLLEQLDAERATARKASAAADTRLEEARSALGYRGERLRVIDPGIVPERPSSPNIVLNVLVALFAALALSVMYLTIELGYATQRAESNRRAIRVAGRHD
jgi:uncharacterized protein involved in exopolysaccharide biosynthesis